MMLHLWMYDLSVSLRCCTQALTSSIDAGRLYVDLKLLIDCFVSSSQLPFFLFPIYSTMTELCW
jgi:hypothetical protein